MNTYCTFDVTDGACYVFPIKTLQKVNNILKICTMDHQAR